MAALVGRVTFGSNASVGLLANTPKTVAQVAAPANQRVRIKAYGFYFDGVLNTAVPVQIEQKWASAGGTGTTTVPTPVDMDLAETFQSVWLTNCTAEPTYTKSLKEIAVQPQGGYEYIAPLGDEDVVKGGGIMGWQANAQAPVNIRGYISLEE